MFDRGIAVVVPTRHVTEQVTKHVHEHRAPTNESVRLLSEMETAAQDKIIQAVHVGDTTFECVVHVMKFHHDQSTLFKAVFSLNGKKITAEYRNEDWKGHDKSFVLMQVRDAIAKVIANEILASALRDLRL